MCRRLVVVFAFVIVASAVGQLSAGAQSYAGTMTMPVQGVPGGFIVAQAPVTPTATLAAPPPTAGISDAGRAGISDITPMPPNVPVPSSTVVYINQPPVQTNTATTGVAATGVSGAVLENGPGPVLENNAADGSVGNPSANNESGGRTVNDLGPSYYADSLPSGSSTSLAEISAQFKAHKADANARVLTNDDVRQMVDSKNGVTMAKNMPPLGPGALEQGGQAQNTTPQPGGAQSAQANSPSSQTSSSTNQQANSGNATQGGTPPPASAAQGNTGSADTSAENATTPQVNQNQQSNDAQGSRRLPATATFLPLLSLLGLLSGGIGLWVRKFRK